MADLEGSYINEADTLAYFTGDPRATAFVALTGGVAWYLKKATKVIDALPLRGHKYMLDGSQVRQFPREYRDGYDMNLLTGYAEVPQCVLDACCEEALGIFLRQDTQRLQNQREGVVSQTIAGSTETYSPGAANRYNSLMSKDAYDLLSSHIARSFPIV